MFKKTPILLLAVICLVVVIGNSCKKDSHSDQQNATSDPAVAKAKSWYESTYPVNTSKVSTQTVTPNPDLSSLIRPDWNHAVSYTRFNKKTIELPIDPSSKFGSAIKKMPGGQGNNPAYSRSSFILFNNGNSYNAYVMTIIADSLYLRNDLSKLDHNKYNKRDSDFSGVVLYNTPKGEFISAWFYNNGKITNSLLTDKPTTQKVQSVQTSSQQILHDNCTYWYQDVYVGGIYIGTSYLGVTCIRSIDMPTVGPDGDGGGGGGFPPPDGGGGGGGTRATNSDDTNDSGHIVNTDCSSFNFIKTSTANWQEAGVREIRLKWVWLGGSNSGQTRTVYLPSVVFGLPTQYQNSNGTTTNLSPGAAAVKAAKATEAAKILTYVEFRNSPYFPSDAEVLQYFKGALATAMAAERGTAGATGSGSSSIIFQNEERSDFFPYSCN